MDTLFAFAGLVLHIDKFLDVFAREYGSWVYVVLFLIVFCETGLVVFPFLPGDSLLFIGGAFSATGLLDPILLCALLVLAAILGNTVNYAIGRRVGVGVYQSNGRFIRFIDRQALQKTHDFYERHGGKTIMLARFIPVIRTFAPFVAGVSGMSTLRFQLFNIGSALLWVLSLVWCGYFFGNLPFIKQHLNTIVLVGVAAAVVPLIAGACWRIWRRQKSNPVSQTEL